MVTRIGGLLKLLAVVAVVAAMWNWQAVVGWAAGEIPAGDRLIVALGTDNECAIDDALAAGASPNARDLTGMTALMTAAARGNISAAADLLARGADLNASDNWGNTALSHAARCDRVAMLRFLIERGADPALRNRCGDDAAAVARSFGSSAAADLLCNGAIGESF